MIGLEEGRGMLGIAIRLTTSLRSALKNLQVLLLAQLAHIRSCVRLWNVALRAHYRNAVDPQA